MTRGHSPNVVYRVELAADAGLTILRQIRERHQRGHGLAGALDDQPLTSSGLVQQLSEMLAYIKCGNRSHSAIIPL